MSLVVTVTVKAGEAEWERAGWVAERCAAPRVERPRRFEDLVAEHVVYVVGRERDELRKAGNRLSLNPGLLRTKLHRGPGHPLIAALAPSGRADHVIDATLGLAGDALHIAGALACPVTGIEVSPPLFSLAEEGLPRLCRDPKAAVADAASRVRPVLGDCAQVLREMPADSADAVLLAPMYQEPDRAAPGFGLLRSVAVHAPLTSEQVEAALHVAPRVAVKWPSGLDAPEAIADRAVPVTGKAVDYWVLTR